MNYKLNNDSVEDLNLDNFFNGKKASILYTDPPWNNFKFWSTLAFKQTQKKLVPTNNEYVAKFLNNVARNYLNGYFFLEIGVKCPKEIIQQIFDGLYNFVENDVYYKSGSDWLPSKLYVATTNKNIVFRKNLNGVKCNGPILPRLCIDATAKENEIVFDPFCGLGNTAKATIANNMTFYGNEFNSKRLNKTLELLRNHYEKTSN